MIWEILLSAVALVLIVEGLLPAIAPEQYQKIMSRVINMEPQVLRYMGLAGLIAGALIMFLVHSGVL